MPIRLNSLDRLNRLRNETDRAGRLRFVSVSELIYQSPPGVVLLDEYKYVEVPQSESETKRRLLAPDRSQSLQTPPNPSESLRIGPRRSALSSRRFEEEERKSGRECLVWTSGWVFAPFGVLRSTWDVVVAVVCSGVVVVVEVLVVTRVVVLVCVGVCWPLGVCVCVSLSVENQVWEVVR